MSLGSGVEVGEVLSEMRLCGFRGRDWEQRLTPGLQCLLRTFTSI